jgi:hypothetical protein
MYYLFYLTVRSRAFRKFSILASAKIFASRQHQRPVEIPAQPSQNLGKRVAGDRFEARFRLVILWRSLVAEIVRNSPRQFVILFGTLLSLSNDGSLLAGTLSRPEFSAADTPDIFPKDIVARGPVRPAAEDHRSEPESLAFAKMAPNERGETTTALHESLQLLGKAFNGPLEKLSCPGAESYGLVGEDVSWHMPPQPSAPSHRGETGAAGIVPTIGPRDQQCGFFTRSVAPNPEGEERLIFHRVRLISDSPVARIFRPPREQF